MIIAVLGDPNSGKSVFLRLLYDELARRNVPVLSQEADIFAPTQGWSLSPVGATLRKQLKKTFDYKMRLNWIITSLKNLKKYPGIVLADVGGGRPDVGIRVTDENYEILKLCDYAVIVSRNDKNQINAWLDEIRQKLPELKIIACYESVYNPEGLYNFSNDNAIWHLDRTAYANGLIPEPTLQKIRKLADKILSL